MRSSALRLLAVGVVGLMVAVTPVVAHHSFAAEFDASKPIKLQGKVTRINWTNPHVWIYLNVTDEAGKVTNWGFEMGAPHQVRGQGWDRDTLKTGDEIIVEGSRARDGSSRMNARNVTWAATGKKLGAASSQGASCQRSALVVRKRRRSRRIERVRARVHWRYDDAASTSLRNLAGGGSGPGPGANAGATCGGSDGGQRSEGREQANPAPVGWARQLRSARRREGRVESSGLPRHHAREARRNRGARSWRERPTRRRARGSQAQVQRDSVPAVGQVALDVSPDARNRTVYAVQTGGRIPQHGDAVRNRIRPGAGTAADVHLPDRRAAQLPADLHGRPRRIRRISTRATTGTPSASGKAIRSSSTPSASTNADGSTPTARRPPSSLHLTEKFTRVDFKTLRYEITIDDPGRVHGAVLRPAC